jgi:branched-chain amino acid transport system permease protein
MSTILPQLIVNGLIAGSMYALVASGFSLIYYVIKFLNFAHGAILTVSAYLFFLFLNTLGMNFVLALLLSIFFSILLGLSINFVVYKPLRKKKSSNVVLLIVSLALLSFFTSLVLAVFGSSTKTLLLADQNIVFDLGLFRITIIQVIALLVSIFIFFLLWFILKKTKLGKSMRALADNKDVAQVVGINPEKVYSYTFIIASFLAAIAGILIGLDQNLFPALGFTFVVKGFISAVVGGINFVPGSIVGGYFIGIVENLGIWFLPSGYKDAISFTILLIFLLFRPQGILGKKDGV